MVDPTTALTGIATALSLLERVATLAKSVGDTKNKPGLAELEEKLNEARGKIGSITGMLAEQAAENYRLLQELHKAQEALKAAEKELENAVQFGGTLTYRENAYWTDKGDGPFCSGCWDSQKKATRLAKKGGICECPVCKHTYIVNKTGMFPPLPGVLGPSRGGDDDDDDS
jgi:hypothetical protein